MENASREEKLAFFINVYNALVIHAFVVRGPPTNLWQRYKVRCLDYFLQFMQRRRTVLDLDVAKKMLHRAKQKILIIDYCIVLLFENLSL